MTQDLQRKRSEHVNFLARIYAYLPHNGPRSIELDFVRGIAILLVVGAHARTIPTSNSLYLFLLYPGKQFGGVGVDLFFVLSGFLVGGLLMKEYKTSNSLDARRFIFRRGMKIWPAYYFYILLEIVTHSHPLKTFLWQNLLHIQNYTGSSLSTTWSLAVEEHFYLAFALGMAWVVKKQWAPLRILKWLSIIMGVVFLVRTACYFSFGRDVAFAQTQCRLDALVCGVILALVYHFFPDSFQRLSRQRSLLITIVGLTVAYLCLNTSDMIASTIGYCVRYLGASALLLLLYSHSARIRNNILYRIVAIFGVYSYGIYLYHYSVTRYCLRLTEHLPASAQWPTLMLTQYLFALLLGATMTLIVEWPFLRYRDRIFPQRVADLGSPAPAETQA